MFSHVGIKYCFGFKNLLLTYWNGKTVINLDFSTHIELRKDGAQGMSKKELSNRYSKGRGKTSHGEKRVNESMEKKTSSLLKMLKRVLRKDLTVRYLLADSWFFNSELVKYIKSTSIDLISRPKLNNWKYWVNGKAYTIGRLIIKYKSHKVRKYSRKLKMYTVTLNVSFKNLDLTLYLFKPKKRGSKWQVLTSTHKGLTAIKAYEIYKNRWAIEVTFKELKQHFNFGKCQSRDFDGQIADHTISLLAYNYLSVFKSKNQHESIGMLFRDINESYIRPTIMQMFWKTINRIAKKIEEMLNINSDEILQNALANSDFLKMFNLNYLVMTTET
jgi:hypothetical protein